MTLPTHAVPTIRGAIAAADSGDFSGAIRQSQDFSALLPVEMYRALAGPENIPLTFGTWLTASSEVAGRRRLFSTWNLPVAADWLRLEDATGRKVLRTEGDGVFRTSAQLELVTLGQQNAAIRYAALPEGGNYVVHLLASFPSNVGDNFYLQLEGPNCIEAVRFSNTSVTLVSDDAVSNVAGKAIKLYTLEVAPDRARLYVNGVLQMSQPRPAQRFTDCVIKLIGEHGPDLSGFVHGFEVQHLDDKSKAIFGDDRALFLGRLQELLAERNAREVYHLLRGIDEDWVNELDGQLLSLLDAQVSERGVQEWIYDTILGRVAPESATQWVSSHRNRLPAPVLSVSHVTAQFMLSPNNRFALASILRRKGRERFLVLNDISFDVFPGDIVGIIGPNGAGKSTLLRAIAGLMPIQKGQIVLRAQHLLLSAGIGARNELTGRENIYLAGTFMGLSKAQIDGLFDEILEFSELGAAIDKPFKYYSDGMKGRLVFSLATSVSPQILMLDELLSAGDIKFQKKAADRMEQMLDRAKAVIVVTHSVSFVAQRCNKALLVSGGRSAAYGDPMEVISRYLNILHLGENPADSDFNPNDIILQQEIVGGFGDHVG